MKIRLAKTIIVALLVVFAGSSIAVAGAFDNVLFEPGVIGSGANRAALVIDFDGASFAWDYRWDGSVSGFDMLSAAAAATDLDFTYSVFEWDDVYGHHEGKMIDSIAYGGYSRAFDQMNASTSSFWGYWTADDDASWAESWIGSTERTLQDGSWDAWVWTPAWPAQGSAPDVPMVPEPGSLIALALGIGGALLRKRM